MRYDGSKRYDGYQRSLASMVYTFFDNLQVAILKTKLYQIGNYLKNYTNQLLGNE